MKAYEKGKAFEKQVAKLFARLGFKNVIHDKIVDGSQIDIFAQHELPDGSQVSYIIECKNYSGKVSVEEVNKFASVFKNLHYAGKADKGVMVSTAGFTAPARQAAESFGVELHEFNQLVQKVNTEGLAPKEAMPVKEGKPDRKYVFVLMPFHETFEDIYYFGIRGAVEDAGFFCERVDEIHYTGGVIDKVYEQIKAADIIVAEMTGRNPNVFYEVGFANALSKQVVLIVQNAEDIPFDLRGENHIVYDGKIKLLREKLAERLRGLTQR